MTATETVLDTEAMKAAERRISDLDQKLNQLLCVDLAGLEGFFSDDPLALSVVGAIRNRIEQGREQVGPLREAARSLPRLQARDGGASS